MVELISGYFLGVFIITLIQLICFLINSRRYK